jgi:hypothetical protein
MVLDGPHRGRTVEVDLIDKEEGTCRIWLGDESCGMSLDLVDFGDLDLDEPADIAGVAPEDALSIDDLS